MKFEWDTGKARANRDKHGVTFELAAQIFKRDRFFLKSEFVD